MANDHIHNRRARRDGLIRVSSPLKKSDAPGNAPICPISTPPKLDDNPISPAFRQSRPGANLTISCQEHFFNGLLVHANLTGHGI